MLPKLHAFVWTSGGFRPITNAATVATFLPRREGSDDAIARAS